MAQATVLVVFLAMIANNEKRRFVYHVPNLEQFHRFTKVVVD